MKAGDLVKITKEFGKYYYQNKDISGMIGLITYVDETSDFGLHVLLSNGVEFQCCSPHVWIEVISESR